MESQICIFGDSTAWGAWDKEKGGWVNRLWLYCAESYTNPTIYNLSISGGTTETILQRFESEAKIREATSLIFQTGGNDASYDASTKEHQVPTEVFEKNLEEIIKRAKNITTNIIFIGFKNCDESKTMPVSWCNFCYTNKDIQEYNEIMKTVCVRNAVDYIDVFGLLNNEDLEDGLHPNANGHAKLYDVIQKELLIKKWI